MTWVFGYLWIASVLGAWCLGLEATPVEALSVGAFWPITIPLGILVYLARP